MPAYAITVTGADGPNRFGPDEMESGWVPFGLSWDSSMPGGHKTASFNLRRRIDRDVPELRLLDDVRIYDGAGNRTLWEGRIARLPRSHGDDYLLNVQAVGWAAHLKDDSSFHEVYVDRDPASWGEPSLNERIRLAASGFSYGTDYTVTRDTALAFSGVTGQPISSGSRVQVFYDPGSGLAVAALLYKGTEANTGNVEAAQLVTSSADDLASTATTALTLDDTLRSAAVTSPVRYATLRARASATHTPAAGSPFSRIFKELAIVGNHGLTVRDTTGLYITDMLADAIARAAPLLNLGELVEPGFVVPQAAYRDAGEVEAVVLDLNKYALYEWGVYDRREFFYRPRDPNRLTWEAGLAQGAHLSLEGDDSDDALNGVVVVYSLPDGTRHVAGPPGSGLDVEDAALGDSSAENSVNAHGIPRKYGRLEISFPTTDAGAVQIGYVYLAERSLPARKGQVTLTGTCLHPTKGERPVDELRAGDWIRLSDHPADVPRWIAEASFDADARTATVSVGNDIEKTEAILERLGVQASLV